MLIQYPIMIFQKYWGSRFATLSDDNISINQEDVERDSAMMNNYGEGENMGGNYQNPHEENMQNLCNIKAVMGEVHDWGKEIKRKSTRIQNWRHMAEVVLRIIKMVHN
jgi:hypothetical protein